ncbi:hypothetical protein ACEPAF_7344 [Sanghuangporus sanghuang]
MLAPPVVPSIQSSATLPYRAPRSLLSLLSFFPPFSHPSIPLPPIVLSSSSSSPSLPAAMSAYATMALSALPRPRSKKHLAKLEYARKCIKIIGYIPAPLPPELPPSPPPSRSPSPVPQHIPVASSSKRKLDALADQPESAKRARLTKPPIPPSELPSGTPSSSAASPPLAASSSSSSTSNRPSDKTSSVTSVTTAVSSVGDATSRSLTVYEPLRRPRHGIESLDFRQMHKKHYAEARVFKYSGEARYLSTYPQSHSGYRPLREPPGKGTPYHTHGGLMALLESLEALISFVYAAWCQDHISTGGFNDSWETIPSYLNWCKSKWYQYVGSRDNVREKSFIGLIHMIEAFTHQRIVRFKLSNVLDAKTRQYEHDIEVTAKAKQAAVDASAVKARLTLPEKSLPSPDTDAASANSTPANPSNGTPSNLNDIRAEEAKRAGNKLPPNRSPEGNSSDDVVSVKESYITSVTRLLGVQTTASQEMKNSEKTLSLAIMREHFPHTFGRMVCSTLSAYEEYEPDMEDGEGELFWPSQCVTGEGIAWVCLMGRAMVREFGKDIGYTSFAGIIPKPGGTASS